MDDKSPLNWRVMVTRPVLNLWGPIICLNWNGYSQSHQNLYTGRL